MPLIVVSPGASHAVCEGTVKPLRLTMLWSKNGGGLTTGGSSNILAVYDLDLYLSRQAELQRQGGNGFFETTEEFFAQTPTDFPGSELKGHEVAPGTGVMMLADVMFRFTDEKHHRLHWHIEKVRQRGRIASHAFQLDVQAIGRFSDAGDPLPTGSIGMRSLGRAALDKKDFESFFAPGGNPRRRLAVRVMTPTLDKVLLSNINPQQTPSHFVNGVGKKVVIYNQLVLSRQRSPRKIGESAAPVAAAPAPASRVQPLDLTGHYVELVRDIDNVTPAAQVISPSTLYVHQIGHAIVGWYSPLPPGVLDNATAGFASPVSSLMLSQHRLVFAGPLAHLPSELRRENTDTPHGAQGVIYAKASGARMDPGDLIHRDDVQTEGGWLRVTDQRGDDLWLEMGLADGRKTRFRRVHKKTRLTYATLGLLHDKRVVASPRDPLAKQLLNEIEPLPPGITAHLARELVGHDMYAALYEYEVEVDKSGFGSPGATSVLRGLEVKIEDILNRVARVLKTFHVDDVVQQAQVILRTYPVESPQRTRSMYDILTEIAANIVERCRRGADQGSLNANIETHLPFGFKTLGISPKGDYRYVFEFDYTGVAGGFRKVLQLAGGKIDVKVSRYKKQGHEYEFDSTFLTEPEQLFEAFDGFYVGGNLGMGYRRSMMKKEGPWGGDWSEGSPNKPDLCAIDTYHRLSPRDFDRRPFLMANVAKPGAALTSSGIGLSYGAYTGMFSVVVSDKVTITGELEKQYELGASVPDETEKVIRELRTWKKAIQSGKAANVPTPGVTLSMGGVTLLTGTLRLKPTSADTKSAEPALDTKEADPHLAQVTHMLDTVAFERGSSTLTAAAAALLDVNLAENRRLIEMDGICQVTSSTSPEFAQGRLGKAEADNQNTGLARFRGKAVEEAIRASCGADGGKVLSRHRSFEHFIDINSQVRETLTGDGGTVLHPHAEAAKGAEGQAMIDTERTLYAQLRRVDVVINGVFTVSLPGR